MEHTIALYKPPESATVDVEVTIIHGSELHDSHSFTGKLRKPSYIVELELDSAKQKTSEGRKGEKGHHDWDERFVFAVNLSSCLNLKLYCKHRQRSDHVIGESTLNFLDIRRHEDVKIELHDPVKNRVSGYITLCLTASATVASERPIPSLNLQSLYSLSQMTKIVESLSGGELEKFSPAWRRFLKSFDTVASKAQKLNELHPPVKVALGAVAFSLQAVLVQVDRDEHIEILISIMADLYGYVADTYSIEKIAFYKETLKKLLAQTTECSYFIGDYQKVAQFVKRTPVNIFSDANAMIKKFEDTFEDLKIELILGSSLQTAVISFRILQKVENIEILLHLQLLDPLTNVSWDSDRTCLRGTRDAIINTLIQWASMTNESGTARSSQIYVLQGPPACGKSSIAHSVAQAFDRQKRLGAAIFLGDCAEGAITSRKISSTMAYLLAKYDQKIGERIAEKIKVDVSLATANIGRQFPDLILSATQDLALIGPISIIIDGLQEIAEPAEQLRFLTAIADYFKLLPPNFRLLLTSRTSEDIARLLPDCIIQDITFDDEGITSDCGQYMSESLRQLFSKNLKLVDNYTVEELHDQLIRRSMGMHFWISTACKFLLSCMDGDECIILESILSKKPPRTKEEAMDHLYHGILGCIPYPEAVLAVCQTLIQSSNPLPLLDPPNIFSASSEYKPISSIRGIMRGLGFVTECGKDDMDNPLFSIHPSLEDFLTNSRRRHGITFYTDRLSGVPSWANLCFDCMDRLLKQNLCELDNIMVLNEEIPDKDNRIRQHIPEILQYACRNWVFHLEELDDSKQDSMSSALQRLETFLSRHFLHWVECMSLLGWVDIASASLEHLALWLTTDGWFIPTYKKHDISVEDSRYILTTNGIQFIHAFAPIISKAAMQTYLSALPLMPSDALLFGKYSTAGRPILKSCSHSRIIVDPPITLRYKGQGDLGAVVHAGSGDLIVKGLWEGGAVFFDAKNGDETGSRISAEEFSAITFSPDGQFIATVARETRTMEIWDVETRSHAKYLTYKFNTLNFTFAFITYSMDGTKIMGVDNDEDHRRKSVFIWDAETGECISHLEVDVHRNISRDGIALSPDGSQIAVTNEIGIQFIDSSTGHLNGEPIELHIGSIIRGQYKYAWSPNGQLFASQHYARKRIRLWSLGNRSFRDLKLGDDRKPLYGPVFSPDSSMLANVHAKISSIFSEAGSVRLSIWDTRRGILVGEQMIKDIISIELMTFSIGHGQEICIYGYNNDGHDLIRRIRIVPTDLEAYMYHPPRHHFSQTPRTIEYYSYCISRAINEFASRIDADGWVLNTMDERQLWIPEWANYQLSNSSESSADGETRYRTLEVKHPETNSVVLRYVVELEPEDMSVLCCICRTS